MPWALPLYGGWVQWEIAFYEQIELRVGQNGLQQVERAEFQRCKGWEVIAENGIRIVTYAVKS